ncbi:hypothetical protein TRVA0_032S01420 [Trichomonascus vanleenenianus]|uniref:uncharacterized protein n=1 Tax=Trichomonascus vanleenenianus TaxID=2268995 RepID=UPI003ECB1BE5
MINQIITALKRRLPDGVPEVVYASDLTYRDIYGPHLSDDIEQAIPIFSEVPVGDFEPIFDELLAELRAARNRSRSSILRSLMPAVGDNWVQTEGDVTKLVYKFILHPVDLALQAYVAQRGGGDKIYGVAQYQTTSEPICRSNYAWVLHSGDSKELVHILELKNTRALREQDFASAQCTEQDFRRKAAEAYDRYHRTWLEDNASVLSVQVSKYSKHCQSISLFGWNAMFLFSSTQDVEGRNTAGGTFFWENKQDEEGMTFCSLLFTSVAQPLKRRYDEARARRLR